jgi:hypothetical protein
MMGNTAADFSAVPTKGLVERARRKIENDRQRITDDPSIIFSCFKKRWLAQIDEALASINRLYIIAATDPNVDEELRTWLIGILDPHISGGYRGKKPGI